MADNSQNVPYAEPVHDPDTVSDPAHDDTEGQDWSAEGGATPQGPATSVDGDEVGRQVGTPHGDGSPEQDH